MCIAIVKKNGATITDEELTNCFENNPDGAGVAYAKDNRLYIVKGIFNVKDFIKAVREAENEAEGAMLIHCRIGTSGEKDTNNCHPHIVNDNCVMIHNGILDIDVPLNSKVSDTVLFVEQLLKPLTRDFMQDKAILNLIQMAIGNNNKFCFLNAKGEFAIVNEEAGEWDNNIWYSNESYSYSRKLTWNNNKTYNTNKYNFFNPYYEEERNFFVTEKDRRTITALINELTKIDTIELGQYPVFDFWTRELKPEKEYDCGEAYLVEIDEELQDEYERKFDELLFEKGAKAC